MGWSSGKIISIRNMCCCMRLVCAFAKKLNSRVCVEKLVIPLAKNQSFHCHKVHPRDISFLILNLSDYPGQISIL